MRAPPLLPTLLLLTLAFGAALVAPVWAHPTALAPSTRFTDGHLLGIALWAEPLRHGSLPSLTTPVVAWPTGADLRPLLWPSTVLGALTGPALALNLTFALVPSFNLLCGWALGRAAGSSAEGSAALGALLAFHPWVVETLTNGQVEQAVLGGAALALAAALVAARTVVRWRALVLLVPGVVTALVGWAAPHVALAGCVVIGLVALVEGARAVTGRIQRMSLFYWGVILASVAVGALAVQTYHAPSFAPGVHVFAPKGSEGRPTGLADLPEVATLRTLLLPGARSTAPVVHAPWLGAVLLGSSALALLRARESRRFVAIGAVLATLALGPTLELAGRAIPLPWAALSAVAPTISRSMSAYRMVAGAVLALALAVSAVRWRPAAVLALALAAMAESATLTTRRPPLAAQPAPVDDGAELRAAGSGPVLDLPLPGPDCPGGVGHYLVQAAVTGRPVPLLLSNPRAGLAAVPGLVGDLSRAFGRNDCADRVRTALASRPFTTVALHTHDAACTVPRDLEPCLAGALGEGHTADGITWWDLR